MNRFVQVLLVINAVIATVIGIGAYGFHVIPAVPAAISDPTLGWELAAIRVAFAAVALFVVWRLPQEPLWLLAVIPYQIVEWLYHVAALALTSQASVYVPPIIIESLFIGGYVAGFVVLYRRRAAKGQRAIAAHPVGASR